MSKENEQRGNSAGAAHERFALSTTAMFSLGEIKTRTGLEPELFLHLAYHGIFRLYAEVPSGMRVFSIDPGSTDLGDSSLAPLMVLESRIPNQMARPEPARWTVRALVLSPSDCAFVRDFLSKDVQFFKEAVEISDDYGVGGVPVPKLVRPSRLPLFKADGSGPLDQSKFYFGVYPRDERVPFIEGVGYRTPSDVRLEAQSIRVLGEDLGRVVLASESFMSVDTGDKSNNPSPVGKAKVTRNRKSTDTEIGLLSLEDVIAELGISESTLYNFYDKKHPSYDPTFPRQVQVSQRRVAILASELAQWIKGRPRVTGR